MYVLVTYIISTLNSTYTHAVSSKAYVKMMYF